MTLPFANGLPEIGYVYHYPKFDQPTDSFRLDIFMSSMPTEQHFDVLHARFFVKTPQNTIENLTVTHPWHYEKAARVCAGVVVLDDRKGKKEEAFSFGGQLNIETLELQTICSLSSSAPILEISGTNPIHKLFIDELEILLAKRQASFANHSEYETLLSNADPFELYLACLQELTQKFEQFPHKDEKYLQFLMFLHSEEHRLKAAGLSRNPVPKMADIFRK